MKITAGASVYEVSQPTESFKNISAETADLYRAVAETADLYRAVAFAAGSSVDGFKGWELGSKLHVDLNAEFNQNVTSPEFSTVNFDASGQ